MKLKNQLLLILSFIFSVNLLAQNYVYHEEFDAVNGWPELSQSDRSLDVFNGRYYVDYKLEKDYYGPSTRDFNLDTNRDFEIETSIQKISGVDTYGISFLYDYLDNNNYKELGITAGGYFRVAHSTNGTYANDMKWTVSSAVKKGNYTTNNLKVAKKGNQLLFYVNNTEVHAMNFENFVGKKINIRVYNKQKISIDYIRVKYTSESNNNNNIVTNGKEIFYDSFDNNNNKWPITVNDDAITSVAGGTFLLKYKKDSGGWTATQSIDIDDSRDFKIETEVLKVSGINNNGFGLIWGRKDSNNQERFFITSGGSYFIDRYENSKQSQGTNWVKSNLINTGNFKKNKLKIEKIGNQVKYYINDTFIFSKAFEKLSGNYTGFVIYQNQAVTYDYLSVAYLDNNSNDIVNNNSGNPDLSEEFSNNARGWAISNNDRTKYEITNGKYYFEHKQKEGGYTTTKDVKIDDTKDFEIETKIDKISGVTDYSYGLTWGKDTNNAFRFFITSNGYYKISRVVNNKVQEIVKWTKSSFLKEGNGYSNIIKVAKNADNYNFFINNNFVTNIDFEPFYGNRIGFEVFNKQEIAIDYVRVKQNTNTTVVNTKRALQVPLIEDFNNNSNNWSLSTTENYLGKVIDGKMLIDRFKKGGVFVSNDIAIDDSKDFIIETLITKEKENSDGLYGITFGRKNSANEYSLLFSNGSYMYRKFENDAYKKIIPFTDTDAIKEGVGQVNKIKIIKSGALLRFYINDQYVNETPFEPFFGNKFGYSVYYDQKISVDYLEVKYQSENYNNPPVVVITEPFVETSRGFKIVKTKDILVKGKATDSDGIYEIKINGVEALVKADGTFSANVPLKYGKNDLVVTATDIKKSSSTKTFTIKRNSPIVEDTDTDVVTNNTDKVLNVGFGDYYALLIGVSEYGDGAITDLEGLPKKDAQDLGNILINNYNFKKENVVILNNNPKANDIIKEFTKLKKTVQKNDNLLVFYAGHGIYDKSNEIGSWLPSDADMEYELNLISNTQVVDFLKSIPSKHSLLISDACFSGSIFKSRSFTKAPKSVQKKYELPSRKAITSGTLKTVPNKSVFLKYLLQRLSENNNKYISARQLFDRIEEPVMNNSPNTPQYGTIHGIGDEGGDFIFIKN